jgi:hypothetical protein
MPLAATLDEALVELERLLLEDYVHEDDRETKE